MFSFERLSELALDAKHFTDKQRSQTNMIDDWAYCSGRPKWLRHKHICRIEDQRTKSNFDLIMFVTLSVRILLNKPNMINDYDAVAHPSGRSPVRIGRYLLASVENENGKRNKPNMINDWV